MRIVACVALITFNALTASPALATCPGQQKGKPSSRFILNGGEVLDKETGLNWQRCSLGMRWKDGKGCLGERRFLNLEEATKLAERAGSGWRLPSLTELGSLVDDRCGTPAVDNITFPDIGPPDDAMESPYWTSSPAVAGLFYFVDFMTGRADAHSKGFELAVRLTRSKH